MLRCPKAILSGGKKVGAGLENPIFPYIYRVLTPNNPLSSVRMSQIMSLQRLVKWLQVELKLSAPKAHDQIEELPKDVEKPKEYLDSFSLKPNPSLYQLLGRDKHLEELKQAYENWQKVPFSLLVIGEPGCGLSSFLLAGIQDMEHAVIIPDDRRIHNRQELVTVLSEALNLTQIVNREKLIGQLLTGEKRVIVFENIERLFLRTLGGFQVLEDLRTIVNQTKKNVFWILSINRYPRYYLKQISGWRAFLGNAQPFELGPLGEESINETIAMRNMPYLPVFLKPAKISVTLQRSINQADRAGTQEVLKEDFYRQLHQFTKGNVSRALLFWLESIMGVRGEQVFLKPYAPPKTLNRIKTEKGMAPGGISREGLFVLEAIFQHGSLSVEDLDNVLRNSEQTADYLINELLKDKWIHRRRPRWGQQEYQINMMYQSELRKMLADEFNRQEKFD